MRIPLTIILLTFIMMSLYRVIVPLWSSYTSPYYTDDIYKGYQSAYDSSQYRRKENAGLIPDETVFSYAAGAYIRGVDPILVNSEHTPLGKYLIGAFILIMKNDKFIVLPSAALVLIAVWLIGRIVLKDAVIALIPVAILATEPLFLNQIRTAPLLDIIQLPWILFSIAAFLHERARGRFPLTAVMIGMVMATKSVIPVVLLVITFLGYLCLLRQGRQPIRLVLWCIISLVIFIASYTRTFLSGYTLADFIGFQKWIFLYQQSKLIFPFSSWRLLLLNQWQAWWGDMSILAAQDWRWTWPVSTILGLIAIGLLVGRKISLKEPVVLLIVWFGLYSAFLSLGVTSSRFFLPLFPVSFIVGTWVVRCAYERFIRR